MACKKSELVQAINTFSNARSTNDPNLINFSAQLLEQFVNTLEFAEEEEVVEEAETTDTAE